MTLTFERATDIEVGEIYSLAGINRMEATGIISENNQEEMIKLYEHSLSHGAYFLVGRKKVN